MPWSRFLLLAALAACASNKEARTSDDKAEAEMRPPLVAPIPPGTIQETARDVEFDEMMDELGKVDIVYVGENHKRKADHAIQLRIIEELYDRGRLHAIGMEQFQRPFQQALIDYVEGRIGEREMLERTQWKERWNMDFGLYRPILEFARKQRIPVRALNVRNEIRKQVREGGLKSVSEQYQRTLPALYLEDKEHREYLEGIYDRHLESGQTADPVEFERFYTNMCLWDDVMADSIVRWFRAAPADAQIVVLVGAGHIKDRFGIPERAYRRNGKTYRTVIPVAPAQTGLGASIFGRRYADYLWVVESP